MVPPLKGTVEFQTEGGTTVMKFDPNLRRLSIFTPDGKDLVAYFGGVETVLPNLHVSKGAGAGNIKAVDSFLSDGPINLFDSNGKQKIRLFAEASQFQLGGSGMGGQILLHPASVVNPASADKSIIFLSADMATVGVGGPGKGGNIYVKDDTGNSVVNIDGKAADIKVGGDGKSGDLLLFSAVVKNPSANLPKASVHLAASNASLRVGGNGLDGSVLVQNAANKTVVRIDGKEGDILLESADCAEDFDVDDLGIEPGTVLVFSDEPGRLRMSDAPYDTRVAGILSGAGDYRPAIVLDRKPGRQNRRPVALVGKVWCKVEAESAPIGVGSLLTSSSLAGHAMAATDRERAFGAVLGKALAPLAAGIGMVPVLVSLQ